MGRENEFSTLKAAYAVSHSQVFPASVFHVQWRLHPASRINKEGIPFNFPSPCIVPATCNPEAGSSFSNLPSLSFVIGKIPSFAKCNIHELFNFYLLVFIFYLLSYSFPPLIIFPFFPDSFGKTDVMNVEVHELQVFPESFGVPGCCFMYPNGREPYVSFPVFMLRVL